MSEKAQSLARPRCAGLDSILGQPVKVLDHGFVRVIDYMGDDAAIVQAARVSYGEGTKKISEDAALINYLMRARHTSPFEMCEIKLHCKMPIFVARQWIRHRTASLNEYSARYSVLKDEFYIPEKENVLAQSQANKQGRDGVLDEKLMSDWISGSDMMNVAAYDLYKHATENGMARELARIGLPLSTYTEWYWKIDLHNLLHFLKLRADPHAQKEIRDYAQVIMSIVAAWVPHTYAAWCNHVLRSKTFSHDAMVAISQVVQEYVADAGNAKRFFSYLEGMDVKGRELQDVLSALGIKQK